MSIDFCVISIRYGFDLSSRSLAAGACRGFENGGGGGEILGKVVTTATMLSDC